MIRRPFPAYEGADPFVFVSYAHRDAPSVYALLEDVRERGINVWYDEGIEPGSNWRDELAAAIDNCSSFVFFVSKASIASRNCLKEVNFALARNKRIVLVHLEPVELPAGLEMSLGDEQGIAVEHHEPAIVVDKLERAIRSEAKTSPPAATDSPARTDGVKRWLFAAALAVAAIAVGWWNLGRNAAPADGSREADTGPAVVAIAPFRNLSGDANVDWIGQGVTTLVADQLAGSRHLVMVSNARWSNISGTTQEPAALREQARDADIDYLVSGEMLPSPEGMVLSVRTTDLANGINVGAQSIDALSRDTLVNVSRQVSRGVMQTLNVPREQQLETLSADFATEDFAAYEAYLSGLQFYNRFDYDAAATAMEAALAIAPGFHMANFRLANIQMSKSQWRQAQETLARIPADAKLTKRERGYVTGLGHMLAGEYPDAIQTFQALLAESPYDVEAQQFMAESYYRSFQEDKAIEVLQALGEQEPENHHVWAAMGYIALSLGRIETAEQALTRYAEIAPELPHPWQLLGTLAMHRQQTERAVAHFERALTNEPDFSPALLGAARAQAYLGNYAAAKEILQALHTDSDVAVKDRISAAFDLAALLQAETRFEAVDAVFERIAPLLTQEKARVALAFTERAYAAMANQELDAAQELVRAAIAQAPAEGVATRYLFARGLLEVQRGEKESIPVTTAAIRGYALPAEDPDQTEERAALLLEGLALAQQRQFNESVNLLQQAQQTQGYAYRSVATALASVQAEAGDLKAALRASMQALRERPQFQAPEPRLDLESDRRRAYLLAVKLSCELDDAGAKAQLREFYIAAWQVDSDCVDPQGGNR